MEALVKDERGYLYYVPEGYEGSLDAIVYYPGAQPGYDAVALDQLAAEHPDKAIIVDMYSLGPVGVKKIVEGTVDTVKKIESDNPDISIGTVDIATHSMGLQFGVPATNEFTDAGYKVGSLVNLDGRNSWVELNTLPDETVKKFAATGVPMYNFGQSVKESYCMQNFSKLINHGVDVTWVGCDTNTPWNWDENHATIKQAPIQNGLFDVLSGKKEALSLNPTALNAQTMNVSRTQIEGYNFKPYDYNTGNWTPVDVATGMKKLASRASMYSAGLLPWNITNEMSAMGTLIGGFRSNVQTFSIGELPTRDTIAINANELQLFKSSTALSLLNGDGAEANSLSGLIDSFKRNNILSGSDWQLAYSKLDTYDTALKQRADAANALGTAIQNAIAKLEACMTYDGMTYDNMDVSQMPEVKEELRLANEELESLKGRLKTYTFDTATKKWVESEDAGVAAQIETVEANIIEINRFIGALENLQRTYDEVIKELDAALDELNAFSSSVASITPSPAYTYTAV